MTDGISHTWAFHWDTVLVDGLFSKMETGWILEGRPRAAPGDGWLVAHDVCHHRPDDTGTYADELATFGAQLWFEGLPEPHGHPHLVDAWFSVMAMVLEQGRRGIEGLLPPPCEPVEVSSAIQEHLSSLYSRALAETRAVFGDWAEPAVWADLASPDMMARAVAHAARGYRCSQERWPDVALARTIFDVIQTAATPGQPGDRLTVTLDDAHRLTVDRSALASPSRRAPGPG